MTLSEALRLLNSRERTGEHKLHGLGLGFEPLHLATFFHACLLKRLPGQNVELQGGVYGDLPGNIRRIADSGAIGAAVIVEWSDVDPRLGLRNSGGWSDASKSDIVASADSRWKQLQAELGRLADRMPVALAPPSLPFPPIGNTVRVQTSVLELELKQQLAAFLLQLARVPGVRVVNMPDSDPAAASGLRLDAKMELVAGFPYSTGYASVLAERLVDVLYQPTPKKGLITDLDDTLWAGLVGEVGPENVCWQQENHAQVHGLYQQMIGHLASCGVLVGACSKNEQEVVEAALARKDLFLAAGALFPVIANWGTKSASVERILRIWNISEDAVVFVDDSPMELEEVQRAFPGITCRQFTGKDPAKVWALLGELQDLFGKPQLTEEDRLRTASIRASAAIGELGEAAASPEFLASLQGEVTIDWRIDRSDRRPLELVNKTNQFNLNGLRISEGEWQRVLESSQTVLAVASYRDKFGPLGKIAVLLGSCGSSRIKVSHWVMSCRAFSRRIEHHTLDSLFRRTQAREIVFDFRRTERNKPLQDFFEAIGIRAGEDGLHRVSRSDFVSACGALPHRIAELN